MNSEPSTYPQSSGIEMSPSIAALAKALCKVQFSIKKAIPNRKNTHFRNEYADITAIWDACREALASNGMAVIQAPVSSNGNVVQVRTLLIHESGEFISTEIRMKPEKDTPQSVGSAITYARRYSMSALLGVVLEDENDDDGNAASGRDAQPAQQTEQIKQSEQKNQQQGRGGYQTSAGPMYLGNLSDKQAVREALAGKGIYNDVHYEDAVHKAMIGNQTSQLQRVVNEVVTKYKVKA